MWVDQKTPIKTSSLLRHRHGGRAAHVAKQASHHGIERDRTSEQTAGEWGISVFGFKPKLSIYKGQYGVRLHVPESQIKLQRMWKNNSGDLQVFTAFVMMFSILGNKKKKGDRGGSHWVPPSLSQGQSSSGTYWLNASVELIVGFQSVDSPSEELNASGSRHEQKGWYQVDDHNTVLEFVQGKVGSGRDNGLGNIRVLSLAVEDCTSWLLQRLIFVDGVSLLCQPLFINCNWPNTLCIWYYFRLQLWDPGRSCVDHLCFCGRIVHCSGWYSDEVTEMRVVCQLSFYSVFVFEGFEWVFIKLRALRENSVVTRDCPQLTAPYYGPYPIIARIGAVANRLQLPEGGRVHPVFHASLLKEAVGNNSVELQLLDHLTGVEVASVHPFSVITSRFTTRQGSTLPQVWIQWQGKPADEPTWKDTLNIRSQFPVFNLEDKVDLPAGGIVRP
ncbi:uncharacterized protein LOC130722691 [Lotus japonicus]|uniref:uncharacterized protein LOC130722691 n=1 Tax=Lotus japonicus TaxID=34305 RepID=UPI00258C0E34|nr:uncharacterized protein LOC130722691 [Lotus japonicus]